MIGNKSRVMKMKKIKKHIILASIFLLTSFNCNTTEPPVDNLQPGRRDYVWSVDTLNSPNNSLHSIWGSSPSDVWVGGPGGVTNYDRLWHFDGNVWKPFSQYIAVYPDCIFGFAQNDVWIGGNDGKIFHFDGSTWSQNYRFDSDTIYDTDVYDISGPSANDIYAIGLIFYHLGDKAKSFVLHYDGINWSPVYITTEYVQYLQVQKEGDNVYISGLIRSFGIESDSVAFYKLSNQNVEKFYQAPLDKITWATICQIGEKTYFLIGKDLTRYINGKFQTITSFNVNNFWYAVYGRNEKDIFLSMNDGVAHYNGEDIEYLYHFGNSKTNISSKRSVILDKDVIFTVSDDLNYENLILRGKLKE